MQPQPLFSFLIYKGGSDKSTLELSNEALLSGAKLNYVNTKAPFVKNTNI